jgi:electron transfer flavoprotein beta subunit
MNIVVLVKQVPDTYSERKLHGSDGTLDRDAADAVLDEINERAVEAALQLKEAHDGSEVTVVTMGPDRATDAIRKALSMGADKAVHLSDEGLHGSCAVQTARALAKVISTLGDVDLILTGNEATDGTIGAVPAMVADVLGIPELTHARNVTVEGRTVTVERETNDAITVLQADLPALVSVHEKINEPRYPSFKGIMAAKKKPVTTMTLADAGIDAGEVGYVNAHGTSTPLGDPAETRVLKIALGEENAYETPVSSTKGATGHTLGAAGAVEAIFTIFAVQRGVLPPTINYETPDPSCDLDYIPNEARPQKIEIGVSNSFGFGGHNACVVFRRWDERDRALTG